MEKYVWIVQGSKDLLFFIWGDFGELSLSLFALFGINYVLEIMLLCTENKKVLLLNLNQIKKFISVLFLIGMANILDTQKLVPSSIHLRNTTAWFYLAYLAKEVILNASKIGIPIPKIIIQILYMFDGHSKK